MMRAQRTIKPIHTNVICHFHRFAKLNWHTGREIAILMLQNICYEKFVSKKDKFENILRPLCTTLIFFIASVPDLAKINVKLLLLE